MSTVVVHDPSVLICEPEYELRHMYMRHFEQAHVPVHGMAEYSGLFSSSIDHRPAVIVVSIDGRMPRIAQFLEQVAGSHTHAAVVVLSSNQVPSVDQLVGNTVSAHLHKQHSSPKELVRAVLRLLSFTH